MKDAKPMEVVIGGKKVVYNPKELDIIKLKYYPENPRVHNILSQYKSKPSQSEIQKELWKLETTKNLYRDVLSNRGLIEPVVVKDNFVLEGNSRLCVYRKLYADAKDNKEKEYWRYIPSIDLPSEVDEKQIFQFLGTCHIRGKSKWRTFEKASYVYRMKNQFGMGEDNIAKDIGISKAEVDQMIDSYVAMEKEEVKDLEKFSYFMELFKNRQLKKVREDNPEFVKQFATLVKEDVIPRAEDVRDLPKIMADKKARKSFEAEKDFHLARSIAFRRNPEHESTFLRHLKNITGELQDVEIPVLLKELQDGSRKNIVKKFIKEVERFKKNIKL